MRRSRIGILALQGDFAKHRASLEAAGAEVREVRTADQLSGLEGLVLPGGESTALLKLIEGTELDGAMRRFHASGGALYGTCAGLILLATRVRNPAQASAGLLDVEVLRNGYGRQIDSFEADEAVPCIGDRPLRMVFIRAPVIASVGSTVEVLAECRGRPVMVRGERILATTFHPELTADLRVHQLFIEMCAPTQKRDDIAVLSTSRG